MTDPIRINSYIAVVIGLATLLAVIAGWARWVRPRLRRARLVTTAVTETILGRDAIHDASTGVELVPAQPGLGVRLASQETQLRTLADALTKIAGSHERLDDHEARIRALELLASRAPVEIHTHQSGEGNH